ncbi:hypothetical protein PLICRDRAFT_32770 [Plicaturopsis crispa FD-325 SS-3]|uniref:Uncharacterized protein n=1 Tax=Plicaturopsis crispa FD-325 SS-3 TaxID=944288 RepID=A0A0C9SWM5_PLICR|nr:hypothetical protein PLICRDRAFT_32770 [Plicaturopsis crispa FD-325 SS-3]
MPSSSSTCDTPPRPRISEYTGKMTIEKFLEFAQLPEDRRRTVVKGPPPKDYTLRRAKHDPAVNRIDYLHSPASRASHRALFGDLQQLAEAYTRAQVVWAANPTLKPNAAQKGVRGHLLGVRHHPALPVEAKPAPEAEPMPRKKPWLRYIPKIPRPIKIYTLHSLAKFIYSQKKLAMPKFASKALRRSSTVSSSKTAVSVKSKDTDATAVEPPGRRPSITRSARARLETVAEEAEPAAPSIGWVPSQMRPRRHSDGSVKPRKTFNTLPFKLDGHLERVPPLRKYDTPYDRYRASAACRAFMLSPQRALLLEPVPSYRRGPLIFDVDTAEDDDSVSADPPKIEDDESDYERQGFVGRLCSRIKSDLIVLTLFLGICFLGATIMAALLVFIILAAVANLFLGKSER